ncbi:hypothetical protein VTO42DRAFT_2430 [Malbranchea cinnamomea]
MWILPLIGYLGVLVGFCFLTLAIASGLYYLSELVEEHTVPAKRVLHRLIHAIIALLVALYLLDSLPLLPTLLSIGSHAIYALNLRRFPFVRLSDPVFLLSCALVALNHWVWFRFFSDPVALQARSRPSSSSSGWRTGGAPDNYNSYNYYAAADYPSFTEIASFFGLCVWLVPFALFVSLSAGDNVLPSMGSEYATGGAVPSSSTPHGVGVGAGKRNKNVAMAKALVDGVREWMGETGQAMGWWRGEKVRRF